MNIDQILEVYEKACKSSQGSEFFKVKDINHLVEGLPPGSGFVAMTEDEHPCKTLSCADVIELCRAHIKLGYTSDHPDQ